MAFLSYLLSYSIILFFKMRFNFKYYYEVHSCSYTYISSDGIWIKINNKRITIWNGNVVEYFSYIYLHLKWLDARKYWTILYSISTIYIFRKFHKIPIFFRFMILRSKECRTISPECQTSLLFSISNAYSRRNETRLW